MSDDRAGPPPNGTQAHEQSRERWFGRPAQLGATPFGDSPALATKELERKPKTVTLNNERQDSVTYVLTGPLGRSLTTDY